MATTRRSWSPLQMNLGGVEGTKHWKYGVSRGKVLASRRIVDGKANLFRLVRLDYL